jgi:hypothetical protein
MSGKWQHRQLRQQALPDKELWIQIPPQKTVPIFWNETGEVEIYYGHLKVKIELIEPVKRQ